jgi:LysM repeat protein
MRPVIFLFGGWIFSAVLVSGATTTADTAKHASTEDKDGVHKVKRGETLWSIARLHNVSVGEIMDFNHLENSNLHDGQSIKIPPPATDAPAAGSRPLTHLVIKGETFRVIAKKYGITSKELEKANPRVDPDIPKAGTKLTLPAEKNAVVETKSTTSSAKTHSVTEKDTFYVVAKKYGVSVAALTQANPGVNPDKLHPGMKLNLPSSSKSTSKETAKPETKPDPEIANPPPTVVASAVTDTSFFEKKSPTEELPPAEAKPKFRRYIVSEEETPQTISEAFNITLKKLYEMNDLKPGAKLKSGQEIKVPLNTTGVEE